jgi:hypothetical protein
MSLPASLKAEVKFTTATAVQLDARELAALSADAGSGAGIVAVLFWSGDRSTDGRWVIVDAAAIRSTGGETVHVTRDALLRTARMQPRLDPLRQHLGALWRPFLQAFHADAMADLDQLTAVLERCHRGGLVRQRLPPDEVLDIDHRTLMESLLQRHGESMVGRILQVLLTFALAQAGYRRVTINQVGVPDFDLSDLAASDAPVRSRTGDDDITVTRGQAELLIRYCREAGDALLATVLEERLGRPVPGVSASDEAPTTSR